MSHWGTRQDRMLWPDEVRKLKKIVDELDEQIDARSELLSMVSRDAVIDFLTDQAELYGSDETDELYHDMNKLLQQLRRDKGGQQQ